MATYTLIPSSLTGGYNITNASNAYTDTSSTTFAEGGIGYGYVAYLGGFDFSVIPTDESVTALTVKVKAAVVSGSSTGIARLKSSSSSGVALSDDASIQISVPSVKTLTLTSSVSTIYSYKDTLSIELSGNANYPTMYVYGAEIIVETVPIVPNKIIYGNETLIDLTSDTATASDVASGKTFHLASGEQVTGTFSASMNEKFMTRTTTTLFVTDLEKQPDWFVVVPTVDDSGNVNMLAFFLYDGTNTYTASSGSGIIRINQANNARWSMSFSNGTLTLTKGSNSSSPAAFSSSKYKIYYL